MNSPQASLQELNNQLTSGRVFGVAASDVEVALSELVTHLGQLTEQRRVITIELDEIPTHDKLLEQLSMHIARTVGMLWPDWYGEQVIFTGGDDSASLLRKVNARQLTTAGIPVHHEWFQQATKLCLAGELPWLPDFSATVQLRQMAECLRETSLCIVLALTGVRHKVHRLNSLERGAEWLAREAAAAVVLVIPEQLADHDAFAAIHVGRMQLEQIRMTSAEKPVTKTAVRSESPGTGQSSGERKHVLHPLIGRPHPASPGEQRLAEVLANDAELGDLFKFNQPVDTIRGNRFLVDLIWVAGNVVVEVDGYGIHSTPHVFSSDRQRDYELLISGCAVLRIPHDEILHDAVLAMEKIRDVVRWRRDTMNSK